MAALDSNFLDDVALDEARADRLKCVAQLKALRGAMRYLEDETYLEKLEWQCEALERAISLYDRQIREATT